MEHKIELLTGYTDKNGVEHREVTFGKRLTVGDLIQLDSDPRAANPTQYNLFILAKLITQFGTLKSWPDLEALLVLDSIDREDLSDGGDAFLAMGREGKIFESRDDNVLKLYVGFDVGGTAYDVVKFGHLTTGKDEVEADTLKLGGIAREAFLFGKQITQISNDAGGAPIDGAVGLDLFKSLDAADFNLLRIGAQKAKDSFRLERAKLLRERNGESRPGADEGNGNERAGDSKSAAGKNEHVSESA